jgi:hypothetical protein
MFGQSDVNLEETNPLLKPFLSQRLVLPLLWSSFSARQAITEQQSVGVKRLAATLAVIRTRKFYAVKTESDSPTLQSAEKEAVIDPPALGHDQLADAKLIEDHTARDLSNEAEQTSSSSTNEFLHLSRSLHQLPALLNSLRSNLAATSTTRTSLHSTLSAYTSQLHTQSFISSTHRPSSSTGVGLNTLSDNLTKEAGGLGTGREVAIGSPIPEWETLRKEVRGLKGLLLSRSVRISVAKAIIRSDTEPLWQSKLCVMIYEC